MINLRYHIVSLTAVFLAIGIGLTLGSTFLDRATVDNLQGQLESLEQRLDERDEQIQALEEQLQQSERSQTALDEQGRGLLGGQLESVPVVVLSSVGVDQSDVDGAVQSLVVAGADVQGEWRLTERFLLAGDADIADLAAALGEDSDDPSRLRRAAIAALGRQIRDRQHADVAAADPAGEAPEGTPPQPPSSAAPPTPGGPGDASETTPTTPDGGVDDDLTGPLPIAQVLAEAGFLEFEPVSGGADGPDFPVGTHLVIVGGSPDLPDDVVLEPLVERLALGSREPLPVVVSSAMDGDGDVSDVVAVIRENERLRSMVATVDDLEHFQGWAALVLALADIDDAVVGHYGLAEGATRLLPPLQVP